MDNANKESPVRRAERDTTIAFRLPVRHRLLLESIRAHKGHKDMTTLMREAVDEYIRRNLSEVAA